ncbi:hypothetical protein JCM10207_006644 [Rhodosporidiobolus poonsookiae]
MRTKVSIFSGFLLPKVRAIAGRRKPRHACAHSSAFLGRRNVCEIVCLPGCDFLTISPALLKELQNSTDEVKPVLDQKTLGDKLEKVTFVDNEPAFRWSLLQDQMAFDKLHEGIKKFAEDAEELKGLLKAKLQ